MRTKTPVKMSDIAAKLGVSIVTVSKALNDKEDGVSRTLKEQIKKTANEMGYKKAGAAQGGTHNNIGVIISERFLEDNSFYWQIYQNLQAKLVENGYFGILEICRSDDEKKRSVPRIISDQKVDVIIIIGQLSKPYLEMLTKAGVDVIFVDFYDLDFNVDTIIADNFNCSYQITKYLIDRGHRDIVFIGNIFATSSIMDRAMGYYKCMLENNCPIRAEWYIPDRDNEGNLGIELPTTLPTAFVCNSDKIATLLNAKLTEYGYTVPQDVSVVGFDNYHSGNFDRDTFTTIDIGRAKIADAVVDLLKRKYILKATVNEQILLKGSFIEKKSVRSV